MEQETDSSSQLAENMHQDLHGCIQVHEIHSENKEGEPEHENSLVEEVHVLYLNVPPSDEPQMIDLSSLLMHDGIQMIESSDCVDQITGNSAQITGNSAQIHTDQVVVAESEVAKQVVTITSQSETQSAHALLHLAKSQMESGHVQVSDILAGHHDTEHDITEQEQNTSAEALLQLSSDAGTGTYIVDETGTMIPISQMRSNTLIEVEETGVTTVAICQCWCGREFISQDDLDRHKLAHKYQSQARATSGVQKCTLCLESFLSSKELKIHHTEAHPGGMPWECGTCHRTFHKKNAMKAHMRVHNTLTRYQCTTCKKVFFYKTALNRHLKMHSCEKPFKCTICGDMYYSLWDLRKHRMNHQPPKVFACDICSKVFKQKQTLFVHSRIHTGQKPYTCEVCYRNFSLKATLVQHQRIHTGEKPNVCHICERAFRQNSTLKAHLRTHANLKPFMCRYCKMRFSYKDEVAEHERTHSHNKTWQCDDCGMWFKNQSLLTRHSRVHTNERPFCCSICYKSFVQSGSLQSHMRSHTKERPYQCRICLKAYYTSGTLLVHIRKCHNLDAKSVKEIFPVYRFLEDQKVFTIRNSIYSDLKSDMTNENSDEGSSAEKANFDELLNKDNAIVEELIETSGEIIVQDSKDLNESTVPSLVESTDSKVHKVDVVDSHSSLKAAEVERKEIENKDAIENTVGTETEQKEASSDSNVEVSALYEASQRSHAAHDRQEAALGLAELSLTGAEGIHLEKRPQPKTRTFFREEEEDENDPNVTKIILSKEGGIMNSQDPHQCPVCGRIFGRKSILIEHIRIHTDEKPYECDFCQASFRQNAQLRSHIRNNHTQLEKYRCSFCHNRFLSRSITIRHINFHHKLKIKFCQNMDPAWTVESAVSSDDNFETTVGNPHVVKTNKKKKISSKENNKVALLVEKNIEADILSGSADSLSTDNKYVINVSQPSSETDAPVKSDQNRVVCLELSPTKRVKPSVDVLKSATEIPINEVVISTSDDQLPSASAGHDLENEAKLSHSSPRTKVSLVSGKEEVSKSADTTAGVKAVVEAGFGNSRLVCGICSVQFRGVSSLRYHLRKVHKKSLDPSKVSYIYEDDSTLENNEEENAVTEALSPVVSADHCKHEKALEKQEDNGTLRIVVYDDSRKCVDEYSELDMPYECLMCTQRYNSKTVLEDHVKSHSEEDVERVGLHRCDVCASVMKNTQQVTKHILKFHGVEQIYVCSICQREFFQQSSVYRHMKFLHKWEMKIRGESSIPVFVKPAPLSMHTPGITSSVVRVRRDPETEHVKLPAAKVNGGEDDVTFMTIENNDTENVQIYKSDGQEIIYEIVCSDDSKTTLRIKDTDASSAAETETNILIATNKNITGLPSTSYDEQSFSPTDVCLQSDNFETASGAIATTGTSPTQTTHNSETISFDGSSSFIVLGSNKSTELVTTNKILSQLVAALQNNSHDNKTGPKENASTVIRVTTTGNTASVSQAHEFSSDKPDVAPSQNINNTFRNTVVANKVAPVNTCAKSTDPTIIQAPIIMSVRDIGATYSDFGPKPAIQKASESTQLIFSTAEKASLSETSADRIDNTVKKYSCFMSKKVKNDDQHAVIKVLECKGNEESQTEPEYRVSNSKVKKNTLNGAKAANVPKQQANVKAEMNVSCDQKGNSLVSLKNPQFKSISIKEETLGNNSDTVSMLKTKQVLTNKMNITKLPSESCQDSNLLQVNMKVKGMTKDARKLKSSTTDSSKYVPHKKPTEQDSTSKMTADPPSNFKNLNAVRVLAKSNKPAEQGFVHRSSSGRLIKRKRFDDEVEEVKLGSKRKK